MLGAFRRSRDYSPASSTASDRATPVANGDWQTFCREEGKKAAREFLRRLKDYRERHPDVSEPCCVREFATSLTELLSASCSDLRKSRTVPSPPKPTASSNSKPTKQQWWKIFKRSKSLRHKDSPSRSTGDMIDSNHPGLVLDRVVSQMNLSDSDSCGKWEKCRLVLINRQGNYQLEIYSPPKSATARTTVFCFLIEDVRSASLLEVPDSDSSFVIKSRSHGEYVFDTDTCNDKEIWINTISQYKSAHIPMSTSLCALSENRSHNSRPNGRPRLSRSRSQTPIRPAMSPPLPATTATIEQTPTHTNESRSVAAKLRDVPPSVGGANRRQVRSMCLDMPSSLSSSPPSLGPGFSNQQEENISNCSRNKSPSDNESSPSSLALHPSVSLTVEYDDTPPSVPPLTRKSSAPAVVQNNLQNQSEQATPIFRSSEALNRRADENEERMSFITVPLNLNERGHTRNRSYDSSYSHSTDLGGPTSPLARNCYRIDVGSSERISSVASGHSSAFSSAGNLHDVTTRDQVNSPAVAVPVSTTPDHLMHLETASQLSNPLYIETSGNTHGDLQLPSHTIHPYQSWANTSGDVENLRNLAQYPWFHGMISRSNATQLVQSNGDAGNGQFLIRQSESREGDFVLTFNCNGRAKHLRFTLDLNVGCFIQHLSFDSAVSMIEYFKSHPIPLESLPAVDDTILTTHIDRSASDSIRTTTVINLERIQRTPPRRSRSIHISSSLATALGNDGSNSPVHGNRPNSRQSNWRQMFSRPTSSSSQSVRSHATVQRTHSANAGSLQEIAARSRSRWSNRVSENTYVSRQY